MSPDGRWASFITQEPHNLRNVIRVIEVATGRMAPFEIRVERGSNRDDVVIPGRHRWMPGSRAIAFVARDANGRSGVFVQDFDPERDTTPTRRRLAGFAADVDTESFAISPDGSRITISELDITRRVLLAEGVAGVVRPRSARGAGR